MNTYLWLDPSTNLPKPFNRVKVLKIIRFEKPGFLQDEPDALGTDIPVVSDGCIDDKGVWWIILKDGQREIDPDGWAYDNET